MLNLLQQPQAAKQQGENAAKVVAQNRGAEDKLLAIIEQLIKEQN